MKHKNLLLAILYLNSFWLIAQPPPTVGLVGHFKFDGNLSNSAPTTMSAASFSTSYGANGAGVANKAVQFGGTTSSYVSITDNGNLDFTGDFSIAFGVYTTSVTVNHGYYDNGLNYGGCGIWFFQSDNTLRFNFKNGTLGAAGVLQVNQWKAVCAVRNGSTLRLYVSGVQVAAGTEGTTGISYPNAPVLGQMYFASGGGNYNPAPIGTRVDEIRFYNRALSAAEIAILVGYSLPIKMGDFLAVQKPAGIQLNWETLTEQNSSHFDVERSDDGVNFTAIGRVNAKGNSTNKQPYTFLDETPMTGINYYRLKLSDIDNSYTYSRIVAIKNSNQPLSLELFPNPASSLLQVQLSARQKEIIRLYITDASGRMIDSRSVSLSEGKNALRIPVLHLPNGTYFLSIENMEGWQTKPFFKR